jgi:hypothetical protein
MEVSGQLDASAALLPMKGPPTHIRQEAGWVPDPVWTVLIREKSCRKSNSGRPTHDPSLWSLSQLSQLIKHGWTCDFNNSVKFNSVQFFIINVQSQQLQGQLQTQHSVDTGNYIRDKHNIKSKINYRQTLEENTLIQ